MERTFTIAGTSTLHGVNTLRFCNGTIANRTYILKRNGHTDIKFVALAKAMTKVDATKWLLANGHNAAKQAVMPTQRVYNEHKANVAKAQAELEALKKDAKRAARASKKGNKSTAAVVADVQQTEVVQA